MNTDSQIKACILQKNSSLFPSRMNRPLRAPTKKDFFTVAIGITIVLTSLSPSLWTIEIKDYLHKECPDLTPS